MKIFLLILFVYSTAFALDSVDRLESKILKVYDKNIIVLNRGLEDDIIINDHIKITDNQGFIARGICIKRGNRTAHFKIYRVTKPELISKDTTYLISSINQSEFPDDIIEKYKNVDFSNYFQDWNESNLDKSLTLQQKIFAEYDFPKDTVIDSILKNETKSQSEKFLAKNFNQKKLIEDFNKMYISIYASPFMTESLNNQRDNNYGFKALNKGKKYDFSFAYDSFDRKMVDAFTKESVNRSRTQYALSFEIKDIAKNWNFLNIYQYEDSHYGNIGNPQSHTQLGLFGFKYIQKYTSESDLVDFSYQFFLDNREDDVFISGVKDPQSFNLIRHGFRIRLKGFFDKEKKFSYDNELWWQPAMDLTSKELNFRDNDTYNRLRLSFLITNNLFVDYENHYSSDINQAKLYGLDSVVITNIVNLRYRFKL